MKISYSNLNTFFDGKLPAPEKVADALTFHAWEIEEVYEKEGDTILDVKVLPDKSAWALSHRGIAKDLSVILNIPLAFDPLKDTPTLQPKTDEIKIDIESDTCRRYSAALIRGVKIGPSPEWLQTTLGALGQKSINNVVDITNYVMFGLGQPLHAFDAKKLTGTAIKVRNAKEGEEITTLTGDTYKLSVNDCVIADGGNDTLLGIAGIKGGKVAEVDVNTTDILLESANFDGTLIRKSSQRLKLRTDASMRFENGVVSDMTVYGILDAVKYILDIAGGELAGYQDIYKTTRATKPVTVKLTKINSVLGLTLTESEVRAIVERFGYAYTLDNGELSLMPPFERPDLTIPEDVIEEIGRIHGFEHVPSIVPAKVPLPELNKRFYYAEMVRDELRRNGFSEIFTSSFRAHDRVKLANALAEDKGYLRSSLHENMSEALSKNAPHADLLGVKRICVFEIGTVFHEEGEYTALALGVRSPGGYKAKIDDVILKDAITALEKELNCSFVGESKDGIFECNFDELIKDMQKPTEYWPHKKKADITYKPFSLYPSISRDIAMWVEAVDPKQIEELLRSEAGELLARLSLFDEFTKDGKTSYAFRLVFQSYEKTLTDLEVNEIMSRITSKVSERSWTVR